MSVIAEEFEECELCAFEDLTLPPRSRLFHLGPVGIGKPFVESLSGYSSRLAETHHVTHASLFGREIAPHIDRRHLRNSASRSNVNALLAASFRTLERAVNGTGLTATDYAKALEKLTLQPGLRYLTMLTWRSVISHRHLLKQYRAWCASCYEERRLEELPIYEQLLWSLEVVTVCPIHNRRLSSRCNHCNHTLRLLDSHSRPGFCSKCNAWLGASSTQDLSSEVPPGNEDLQYQTRVAEQVGSLLAAAPKITEPPSKAAIAASIEWCISNSQYKNEFAFSRAAHLPQSTVNDWRRGDSIPQLDKTLKVCLIVDIPVLEFIRGDLPHYNHQAQFRKVVVPERPAGLKTPSASAHKYGNAELEKAKNLFEILLTSDPPVPAEEIAGRIGFPNTTLRYRFPELYSLAVARYKDYTGSRRKDFWELAYLKLEEALDEENSPSAQEVARTIGCSRTELFKHFPDLCTRLAEKCSQDRVALWEKIRHVIQQELVKDVPRPLKAIAEQLEMNHTSIRNYFPDLCRRLAERYAQHRRNCSLQKKAQFGLEIRGIALALYAQGIYPSVKMVERSLENPRSLRTSKIALDVLRDVRKEFGLDSIPNNFAKFVIS